MKAEIKFYWRQFLRRLPWMLPIVILCTALGLVQATRLPAIYETDARLLVEAPQISDDLVDVIVETSADEEITIIRERLLTRATLLDIADDYDVFENYAEMAPDQIVRRMQAATTINSRGGRNQATLIAVASRPAGQIAADVVNEYVTRILAANVELRHQARRRHARILRAGGAAAVRRARPAQRPDQPVPGRERRRPARRPELPAEPAGRSAGTPRLGAARIVVADRPARPNHRDLRGHRPDRGRQDPDRRPAAIARPGAGAGAASVDLFRGCAAGHHAPPPHRDAAHAGRQHHPADGPSSSNARPCWTCSLARSTPRSRPSKA
jgi:hypothetical protein